MSNNTGLQTVEGAVLPAIEQLLLGDAEKYVNAMVLTDQKRFPTKTAAELEIQVNGDLKHQVRVALGFFGFAVDVEWQNPQYQAVLEPLVAASITTNFPSLS